MTNDSEKYIGLGLNTNEDDQPLFAEERRNTRSPGRKIKPDKTVNWGDNTSRRRVRNIRINTDKCEGTIRYNEERGI